MLDIIMYHYVRPIKKSNLPRLKGLEVDAFERQISYLKKKRTIISPSGLTEYLVNGQKIPDNAALLTFDDGYKDHIQYALPILKRHNVEAAFYPPKGAINGEHLLDVNAVHLILANSCDDRAALGAVRTSMLNSGYSESEYDALLKSIDTQSRYDSAEAIQVKRLLQHAIPTELRTIIIAEVFASVTGQSMQECARQLYMDRSDLRELHRSGMHIGSHTCSHPWLSKLDRGNQFSQINDSLKFLREVGVLPECWSFCFPYGDYNHDTLEILSELGCTFSVTTKPNSVATTDLKAIRHTLPRFDTNDFPQ